jgi:hypothetical protein
VWQLKKLDRHFFNLDAPPFPHTLLPPHEQLQHVSSNAVAEKS